MQDHVCHSKVFPFSLIGSSSSLQGIWWIRLSQYWFRWQRLCMWPRTRVTKTGSLLYKDRSFMRKAIITTQETLRGSGQISGGSSSLFWQQSSDQAENSNSCLPRRHNNLSSIPRTHRKKSQVWWLALVIPAGKAERGGSLGLVGQPVYSTWPVSGQEKIIALKHKMNLDPWRMTSEVWCWGWGWQTHTPEHTWTSSYPHAYERKKKSHTF